MNIDRLFLLTALPGGQAFLYENSVGWRAWKIHDNCDLGVVERKPRLSNQFKRLAGAPKKTWWIDDTVILSEKAITDARTAGVTTFICSAHHETSLRQHAEQVMLREHSEGASDVGLCIMTTTNLSRDALLFVATKWRNRIFTPVIAITGSVGKTTTKEVFRSIVTRDDLPVFIQESNGETLEELACEILKLTNENLVALFEITATVPGVTQAQVTLLRPTMALITAVAHARMESFETIERIAGEHRDVFSMFNAAQIGFVCGDAPLIGEASYGHPVVRFGLKHKNTVRAKKIDIVSEQGYIVTKALFHLQGVDFPITLRCPHRGTLYAALGSAALAHFLHVPLEVIREGLEAYRPFDGRFEQRRMSHEWGVIINDTYTSSPDSMKAAFSAVEEMQGYGGKIAVLGDMLELGDKESFWHRQMGRELCKARSIERLILVGPRARRIGETAPVTMKLAFVDDWVEAQQELSNHLAVGKNTLVLAKASASLSLSRLVAAVTE